MSSIKKLLARLPESIDSVSQVFGWDLLLALLEMHMIWFQDRIDRRLGELSQVHRVAVLRKPKPFKELLDEFD